MGNSNTLCYNTNIISSNYSFSSYKSIPAQDRDVPQKKNCDTLYKHLEEGLKAYYKEGNVHKSECDYWENRLYSLLSDFIARIKREYGENPLQIHRELIYWENRTFETIDKLSVNCCYHSHFKQRLTTKVRDDVLRSKIALYTTDKIFQILDNSALLEMIGEENYQKHAETFPEFFRKLHNSQCAKLKRILQNEDLFKIKIGQILNAYRTISTGTPAPEYSQRYILYFNTNQEMFWNEIARYETKVLNAKIRDEIKEATRVEETKKEPEVRPFASFVTEKYDISKVTSEIRKLVKGKKGKKLAMVMLAARHAGILSKETVPFSTLRKEFNVCGAESGYYLYVNINKPEEADYRYIAEDLDRKLSL